MLKWALCHYYANVIHDDVIKKSLNPKTGAFQTAEEQRVLKKILIYKCFENTKHTEEKREY